MTANKASFDVVPETPRFGTSNKVSVSVHFIRAVLKHALEKGVDPLPLLRRQRISPRILREPKARISIEQFADLQTNTMRAMGDESLGYSAKVMPLGCWDMMCHAVINSDTLGQALQRYCRFFQLLDDSTSMQYLEEGNATSVVLSPRVCAKGNYFAELTLMNMHRFLCWLVQEELPLIDVFFANPISARAADYRVMFMGNPVNFEQERIGLSLATSLLSKPITQTPVSLRRYLRHPSLVMFTTSYQFSWSARVRDQLRGDLRHMPELKNVADNLDLHPQTLRRRLASEGATFKQIKSDIRRDTALHFLAKSGLSVEEVAHRSGFSEASAFIRAFKNWTGLTPYTYRKGL